MLRLILISIVAGFIATVGMTIFLSALDRTGWTNADMVRAVGSIFTRSLHNARSVGLAIHFVSGMVIAVLYLHTLDTIAMSSLDDAVSMGGVFGLLQGFLVGLGIVRLAYRHPVPRFQQADYKVAIAHMVGHVIYGVLIGAVYGIVKLWGVDVSVGF